MISFSVIMPSYLGQYKGAAKDREIKFIRAVKSFLSQDYHFKELIVISDGCEVTNKLLTEMYESGKLHSTQLVKTKKHKLWGGIRNAGIRIAKNDYIIYLDTDDMYSDNYLSELVSEIEKEEKHDVYYVSDIIYKGNTQVKRNCYLNKLGACGTSNIIHKTSLPARWPDTNYAEDYHFIKNITKQTQDIKKLQTTGYIVCHIPGAYDR